MPKDLSSTKRLVKIGEAAQALGVSIDTLRRWERAGKIETIRTPGGTRFYSLDTMDKLGKVKPAENQAESTSKLLSKQTLSSQDQVPNLADPYNWYLDNYGTMEKESFADKQAQIENKNVEINSKIYALPSSNKNKAILVGKI